VRKLIFFKIFTLFVFTLLGQVNHIVGIDSGPSIFGYVTKPGIEVNAHYYLNYKPLLFNLNGGIAPSTNFGLQSQIHINLGFTTSLKKKWSAHLLYGFGKIWVSDEKFDLKKENGETISYYYVYPLWPGLDHIVYAGTFFKPLREKNFCVGLDVSLSSTGIGNNYLFTVSSVDGPSASKANYIKTKPFGVFIKLSYLIKRKI